MSTDSPKLLPNFPRSLSELIRLRDIRKQALAETVGVTPSTLSLWLGGAATPSAEMLVKLADELGVSLDRLIGRATPGAEALYALRAAGLALDNIISSPQLPDTKPRQKRKV